MTMRLIEGDVYDSALTVARRDKLLNIDGFFLRTDVELATGKAILKRA
jgi:hypothetical protein